MRLLEGRGVTKQFGGLTAVSSVDFAVDEGEVVGLIGPNGAGKTTLFNLISGAIVPQSGSIQFKAQNIAGLAPHRICRMGVARTFQSVKVFGHLTALENVKLGLLFGKSSGISSQMVEQEAAALLDFLGVSAMANVAARDLTLPNQKRVEVARALATRPQLLMLDELMAGLNQTEVTQAMELVTAIRDRGITILMIEHVMHAIMNVCGRIMVLHHGEKIAEGTPEEIAVSKKVVDVYLGDHSYA